MTTVPYPQTLLGFAKSKKKGPVSEAQARFALFLHAVECTKTFAEKCKFPYCQPMKPVASHIIQCKTVECKFPACKEWKKIAHHWKYCPKGDCTFCDPLRRLYAGPSTGCCHSHM